MDYLEITFNIPEPEQEIAIAYLDQIGFDSFQEGLSELKGFILKEAYNEADLKEIIDQLPQSCVFEVKEMEKKNWNEEWESNFPDTVVADKIHIRATFHEAKALDHEIIIEPKMSFGTGNHATTFQVMQAMLDLDFENKKVIDIGAGTGILAILAEKLGAENVLALDHDEWCITNMEENKTLNSAQFEVAQCDVLKENELAKLIEGKDFDILLANLNRNLLDATFPQLKPLLKSKTILITSGYYNTDVDHVSAQVSEHLGLKSVNQLVKSDWAVNVFQA